MEWKIYALLSAVFAAATALLAKCGTRNIDPDIATAIRTSVILLLTWGIVASRGLLSSVRNVSLHSLGFLVFSGIATGLSWLFYFKALRTGDVSKVAPIDKLSVAITMLLAFLLLHEPADLKTIAGGLLITAGSILLIL